MDTQLQELTAQLKENQARLAQLEQECRRDRRRARLSWACALTALALTVLLNVRPVAFAQSPGFNLTRLASEISALQTKTAPITTTGNASAGYLMTITKANVQIVDGSGSTSDGTYDIDSGGATDTGHLTGLGNLIIGYNAGGSGSGSHNLILGDENRYSSFGGLVSGDFNTISGPYTSVSGGDNNAASGDEAAVSGGADNTASGDESSVSGGAGNTAGGIRASVGGGYGNTAGGGLASVSGGNVVKEYRPTGWAGGSYHTP